MARMLKIALCLGILVLTSCTGSRIVNDPNADFGEPISQEEAQRLVMDHYPNRHYRWHPIYPCGIRDGLLYGNKLRFGYKLDCEIDINEDGFKEFWVMFRDGKIVRIHAEVMIPLFGYDMRPTY